MPGVATKRSTVQSSHDWPTLDLLLSNPAQLIFAMSVLGPKWGQFVRFAPNPINMYLDVPKCTANCPWKIPFVCQFGLFWTQIYHPPELMVLITLWKHCTWRPSWPSLWTNSHWAQFRPLTLQERIVYHSHVTLAIKWLKFKQNCTNWDFLKISEPKHT